MRRSLVVVIVSVATLASCGGGSSKAMSPTSAANAALVAQVAGYDIGTGREQRFIVGLQGQQGLVSFGTARFSFAYLGPSGQAGAETPGPAITANWIPVAGQRLPSPLPDAPRVVGASEGVGVYGGNVRFDRAGDWRVTAEVTVDGHAQRAEAEFQVTDKPVAVRVGERAPLSNNLLEGATPATAVDSRARNGPLPDPTLHRLTVARAVTSGRPAVVVISTPVYCTSRFCGPTTDTVNALAHTYGDRVNFVHLEVWHAFDKQEINQAAAEWIWRDQNADIHEPWVYVVDARSVVTQRFDNVASDAELTDAVKEVLGAP